MEREIKILLLEDSEDDAGLLKYQLLKEKILFQLVRIDTREEFIHSLDEFKPDVVLSDHSLPQFNSLEALHICLDKNANIPFIMLTGAASEPFIKECLKEGAVDCILKSDLYKVPKVILAALDKRRT